MELLSSMVTLLSHMVFITMVHQLLLNTFDWAKFLKSPQENVGRLRVFLILLSVGLGYLVSHFMLEIITVCQTIFTTLH